MEKEIYEQPEVISHALSHYVDFASKTVKEADKAIDFAKLSGLAISACGTAYLSGLIGKYWFERYARLPVEIDVASEFRYREMPLQPSQAALFISQSARPPIRWRRCAIARKMISRSRHRQCTGIDDRTRIGCDFPDPCRAGNRCRLHQGFHLPTRRARVAGDCRRQGARHDHTSAGNRTRAASIEMPRIMSKVLNIIQPQIEALSRDLSRFKDVLYLGRGTSFSAGAGRCAEAQGNLLYSRRRLCRWRAEARPHRAHRREHACYCHRTA